MGTNVMDSIRKVHLKEGKSWDVMDCHRMSLDLTGVT
jgi:hypothetical protein